MEKFSAESFSHFYNLLTSYPLLSAGVSIFLGLMWCFFGYRIFRVLLVITGAILGGAAGFSCATVAATAPVAWIVGALIGAILGGVLGYLLIYVSVFLLGFGFAAAAAWVLFSEVGKLPPFSAGWSAVIVGVAGGLLALLLMRPLLIVYTALTGALLVAATVVDLIVAFPALKDHTQPSQFHLSNLKPFVEHYWPIIAAGAMVLFLAGALYQFSSSPRKGGGGASASAEKSARKSQAA